MGFSDWGSLLDRDGGVFASLGRFGGLSFLRSDDGGLSIQVRPYQSLALSPAPVAELRFNLSFRGIEASAPAPLVADRVTTWAREVDNGDALPLMVSATRFEAAIVEDRFNFGRVAEPAPQPASVEAPLAAVRAALAAPAEEVVVSAALISPGAGFGAGDATRWVSAFDAAGDGVADRGLAVMSCAVLDVTDYVM